jgi:hypothetical protein
VSTHHNAPEAQLEDSVPEAKLDDALPEVSADALKKAEEFIEEEEGSANRMKGWLGALITLIAIGTTLFHLYSSCPRSNCASFTSGWCWCCRSSCSRSPNASATA